MENSSEDFRITQFACGGFLDRGEYDYCKFVFNDDCISLFFRNSFPKDVYYGPFVIVPKNRAKILNFHYYIKKLSWNGGVAFIHIATRFSFVSFYKIRIENISFDEFSRLEKFKVQSEKL